MAYIKYENLTTPDAVLTQMSTYLKSKGYTIEADCLPDLDIEDGETTDGKRLVVAVQGGFAHLRSCLGNKTFPSQRNLFPSAGTISLTMSESYISTEKWYNQPNAPRTPQSDGAGNTVGVGIGMQVGSSHTLYCNQVTTPSEAVVFSLKNDEQKSFQHLIFGQVEKLSDWVGGMFFSGSYNSYNLTGEYLESITTPSSAQPLCASDIESNLFVRIDVDDAPSRGNIRWASSGSVANVAGYCFTGKQLTSPIRTQASAGGSSGIPRIPHYYSFQSQQPRDPSINSNTLNCITMSLPITVTVRRDPDSLNEHSPIGNIPIYLISLYNIASAGVYEVSYPTSGTMHQAFPMTIRRGKFGYDGFSVLQ